MKELEESKISLEKDKKEFEEYKQREETKIKEEKERLEKWSLQLKKEKEFVANQQIRSQKKIELDVGGKKFSTSLATLTSKPDSMLAAMFSGRFPLEKDEKGRYFVDRNGKHFEKILEWLRSEELPSFNDEKQQESFMKELDYFQILDLREMIQSKQEILQMEDYPPFQFNLDSNHAGNVMLRSPTEIHIVSNSGIFGNKAVPKNRKCYWEATFFGENCLIGIGRKEVVNLKKNPAEGNGIGFLPGVEEVWNEGCKTSASFPNVNSFLYTLGVLVDIPNQQMTLFYERKNTGVTIQGLSTTHEYYPLIGGNLGSISVKTGLDLPE
jgi:hypothetical protein